MVVILKKDATHEEFLAALAKFNIEPRTEKGPHAASFGVLKNKLMSEDGVVYQRSRRQEWD